MELETRAAVRARQGLGEEAGQVHEAGEGDRRAHRQQDAGAEGGDEVRLVLRRIVLLVALVVLALVLVPLGRVVVAVGRQLVAEEGHEPEDLDVAEDRLVEEEDDGSQDQLGAQDDRSQDEHAEDHVRPQDQRAQDDQPAQPDGASGRRKGRSCRDNGAKEGRRQEGRSRDGAQVRNVEDVVAHERSRDDVGPHCRCKRRPRERAQVVVTQSLTIRST